jgi:hypothetical protein
VSGIQVSASGSYSVVDAFNNLGVDVTALLYSGSFNPNAPQSNLLTAGGIDEWDEVGLSSGTNYVLVVQHWCFNREGAWAVTFSGPGSVNSASAVTVPTGRWQPAADPTADTERRLAVLATAPALARSGAYYYRTFLLSRVDMCLQVYTALQPGQSNANRVGDDMTTWARSSSGRGGLLLRRATFREPTRASTFSCSHRPRRFASRTRWPGAGSSPPPQARAS